MAQSIIEFIINLLIDTPIWVWGIFFYLIFVGLQATHDRVIYLPKLLIMPIILVGINYSLFSKSYTVILLFCIGIVFGMIIGTFFTRRIHLKVYKELTSIEVPGTYSTLIILMSIFSVKYIFGYLNATNPQFAHIYSPIQLSICALLSGYFMGKIGYYLQQYKNA